MDVYRQFRRHFASVLGVSSPRTGKASNIKPSHGGLSPSPNKNKGKQSGSDVRIGLQNLVISVQVEEPAGSAGKREDVRLFVIPSTSGLAAGYSVCFYLLAKLENPRLT